MDVSNPLAPSRALYTIKTAPHPKWSKKLVISFRPCAPVLDSRYVETARRHTVELFEKFLGERFTGTSERSVEEGLKSLLEFWDRGGALRRPEEKGRPGTATLI